MTGTRIRYIFELIILIVLATVYWLYFKPYSPDISGTWTPTSGPADTEVRSLIWSNSNNLLIAGSRISEKNTGLAYYEPGRSKWTQIDTGLTKNHIFIDLLDENGKIWAVYFSNPDEPGGVLVGHPGKDDWTKLEIEGHPDPRCIVSAGRGKDIFLLGTVKSGIYRSTDDGESWQTANEGLGNKRIQCLCTDPFSPESVYAGTIDGLYVSRDTGLSWTQLQMHHLFDEKLVLQVIADPYEKGSFYALAKDRDGLTKIYRKSSRSDLWKPMTEGLPEHFQPRCMFIPPDNKKRIFLGTVYDGVYMFDKRYRLWGAINDGLPIETTYIIIHCLAWVPGNNPVLYAGTDFNGKVWQFRKN